MFNRNRDDYQVPLALIEAGLLSRFVTDFYAPEGFAARVIPGFLRRRRIAGLPRAKTRSVWCSFIGQGLARLAHRSHSVRNARTLAAAAGREARRTGSALYCYHSYIPDEIDPGQKLIVFAYHPMPRAERAWIEADARNSPEVAASAARECEALVLERPIAWERADAVVCASAFTAASLVADGCAQSKITVIPYGAPPVPRAGFAARSTDQPAEFLFVGQGIQRKGLHHLIKAWQASPPENALLTIVSYRIEPEIAALIAHPSVRLVGYQPRTELDVLFARSDVFVMPSLIEGFGLVYSEALARGCHVIGTCNTGLPDLALGPDAVTLVEAGDLEELAAAIRTAARRASAGGFDRLRIAAQGGQWSRADFRRAIGAHAASVLAGGR